MKAYLDRAAEAPVAAGECPKVLTALARVARLTDAGCTWIAGDLWVELSALPGRAIIDVYVEQQGSARERMMPGVLVDMTLSDLECAIAIHAVEILPLRRSHRAGGVALVSRDDSNVHERPTKPVPASTFSPHESPTKSGKHKKTAL